MVTAQRQRRRRGSRRADAPASNTAASGAPPGLLERVLSFEAYTGFPHQELGVLVGLLHALDLWVRRGRRGKSADAQND